MRCTAVTLTNKMNYRCPESSHPNLYLFPPPLPFSLFVCRDVMSYETQEAAFGVKLHPSLGVSAILLNLHLNNLCE